MNDLEASRDLARDTALHALGWSPQHARTLMAEADAGESPGRVVEAHPGLATVDVGGATVRVRHRRPGLVVGDWVAIAGDGEHARIARVAERTSSLERQSAAKDSAPQPIAANVDVVLLTAPLDQPLNARRLERMVVVAYSAGVEAVLLLTKADLGADVGAAIGEARRALGDVAVIPVSATDPADVDTVRSLVPPGRTAVLFGQSGAGKTTLTNALTGVERQTIAVRGDGKGRHATTAARLLRIIRGGNLIDTPGVRSVGLAGAGAHDGIARALSELEELMARCRFADCAHETEPGCAVQAAIEDGAIAAEALAAWRKLRREQAWADSRTDARAARELRAGYRRTGREHTRARRRGEFGPQR